MDVGHRMERKIARKTWNLWRRFFNTCATLSPAGDRVVIDREEFARCWETLLAWIRTRHLPWLETGDLYEMAATLLEIDGKPVTEIEPTWWTWVETIAHLPARDRGTGNTPRSAF
ncbi:MAG: hypothetical protein GX442_21080 [Candidatus Riflebacteria bacterium]|nr:hypothetical protein [Candidatus Riflebacteria bacterium]